MLHSLVCYTLLVFWEKPFQLPFFLFSVIFVKELLISVTCELHPSPHLLYPPMLNLKLTCLEGVGRGEGGTEGTLKVPIARSPLAVLLRPSPPVCYSKTWGQSHATRTDRGGKRLSPTLSRKCAENVQRVTNKYNSLSERFKLIEWFLLVSPAQE